MSDRPVYEQQWDQTYRQAYAQGRRHWRPEMATPPVFAQFLDSPDAPPSGSHILEAGCGDGLNAIHLAQRGYVVTGVDVSPTAIARAKEVVSEGHYPVDFLCLDLVRDELPSPCNYDLWVDIKTLHVLWEDADRTAYLRRAAKSLRPGGVLFLNCALAMADVRTYFPAVFAALDPATQASADTLDRDGPPDQRTGIRCETLEWYIQELKQAGLTIQHARREAAVDTGWGVIIVARKPA
ncbi:MAG: class I SAM-dependent methyltransferase [Phycisphaeraceae bacterium]|nr:class I SAM-dependent methyltransferase [Phycisphaeraceae bacterium]